MSYIIKERRETLQTLQKSMVTYYFREMLNNVINETIKTRYI